MPLHVLISGAGIAGPTLAWFLAKTGARITIVEKAKSLLPHGQNVDIQGNAINVIKKMELLDEIRRHNTTEAGTQFISPKGKPFAPFPVNPGDRASFSSEFEILRADLAKIFYKATKDLPDVKYLFGTTVKEVISNDDQSVKVELSNGEVQDYDLLVVADGQWSKLRKQCFPPEDIQTIHKGMYSVYYTIPRLPIDNNWWNIYWPLKSRAVTLRPDPYNTIRAMFCIMPRTTAQENEWHSVERSDRKTQSDLLKRDFMGAGWQTQRILDALDDAPDFYFHVISQIKMKKWSTSRVICLGDTAHAPSPLTGMGTSLAITGAYVLAGELSKLDEGKHPTRAFEAYETTFRPFVEESQEIPPFIPGIGHPETWWARWLTQTVLSILSKLVKTFSFAFGGVGAHNENFVLPEYPIFDSQKSK
jgi:2-polyprenyl-6-methoxyphenol hydroxylase-like FAD-dependent oxidoreductase